MHKRTHASVVGVESVAPMSSTSSTPPNSNPPSNASLLANASSPSNASSASNAASVATRRRIWYTTTPQSYSTETLSKHIAHCTQQKHIAHTTTPQKLCLNMAIGPPTHQCHHRISPAQVTCCTSWARVCASACALAPTQTLVWQPTCKTEPPHFWGCWQVTQVSMPLASTHPRPSSPATPPVTPHATPRRSGGPSDVMQS